jgi:hypothetical protein
VPGNAGWNPGRGGDFLSGFLSTLLEVFIFLASGSDFENHPQSKGAVQNKKAPKAFPSGLFLVLV